MGIPNHLFCCFALLCLGWAVQRAKDPRKWEETFTHMERCVYLPYLDTYRNHFSFRDVLRQSFFFFLPPFPFLGNVCRIGPRLRSSMIWGAVDNIHTLSRSDTRPDMMAW